MKRRLTILAALLFDNSSVFYSVMVFSLTTIFCVVGIALSAQQSIHLANENIVVLEMAIEASERMLEVEGSRWAKELPVTSVAVHGGVSRAIEDLRRLANSKSEVLQGAGNVQAVQRQIRVIQSELGVLLTDCLQRSESALSSIGRCVRFISIFSVVFFIYGMISLARFRGRSALDRAALRNSESNFNNLVIFAPAGISKVDVSGKYEYVSQRWLRLTGLSAEQVFEKGVSPTVHPDDRDRVAKLWDETLHEGRPLDAEYRIMRPDGTCVWVQKHAEPIRDDLGKVTGYLGVIQDISLAKEKELNLRKAHDLALEAAGEKARFLAVMSHEIRTPLNGVIGTASLLAHTHLDEEQQEYVDLVRSSSGALLSVINDILDYSKMQAGKLELEQTDFDLRRMGEEVIELSGESARTKQVLLTCLVSPAVPLRVMGDPHRTRQVLANLVSNAIKFTHRGEVFLRIDGLANGERVRIEVSDTGIGMSPEQLAKLFRPFSQADTATTRLYGGTGLGLSICKELVEKMGGHIGANSIPNKGSTFWVELNLSAVPIETKARGSFGTARLNVFSDNEYFQRRIGEMLRARGVERIERSPAAALWSAAPVASGEVLIVDWTSSAPLSAEPRLLAARFEKLGNLLIFADAETKSKLKSVPNLRFLTAPLKQSQLYGEIAFLLGHRSESLSKPANERTSKPVAAQVPARRAQRLLVADDSPVNQRVIVRMLEKLGYEADVAADGQSAVAMAQSAHYPAVLMDCHMPVMDGLEATKQIRQLSSYRNTPIIALTADVLAENTSRCEAAGMTHFIAKPLQLDELKAVLDGLDRESAPSISSDAIDTIRNLNQPGSPDLLAELANVYFSLVPEIFEQLQQSLTDSDLKRIRSLGHKLRGSSGHIGAMRMAELSYKLECLGEDAGKSQVTPIVEELKREFAVVHSMLVSCIKQAA
jgi:two-component system, sensor histidine kinase and response regulator